MITAIFTLFIWPLFAGAEKFNYPPQVQSAAGVSRLVVSGVKGKLRLVGSTRSAYRIQVAHSKNKQFEDWNLSVERQGDALKLEVFNASFGAGWGAQTREESWPEFDIVIEGPAVPAMVSWRDGRLEIRNWQADVAASLLNGTVRASNTTGGMRLQTLESDVRIVDHRGALTLNGQTGKVHLENVTGRTEVHGLDGEWRLRKLRGMVVADLVRGSVGLQGLRGKIRARGDASAWTIALTSTTELDVFTRSGPITLQDRARLKNLFVSTRAGAIRPPRAWSVDLRNGERVLERKDLTSQGANAYVRSDEGVIAIP